MLLLIKCYDIKKVLIVGELFYTYGFLLVTSQQKNETSFSGWEVESLLLVFILQFDCKA